MTFAAKNKSLRSMAISMLILNIVACLLFAGTVFAVKYAFDLGFEKMMETITAETDGAIPEFDSVSEFVEAIQKAIQGDFSGIGGYESINKLIGKFVVPVASNMITPEFVEAVGGAEGVSEILTKDVVEAVGGAEGVSKILTKDVVEAVGGAEGISEILTVDVVENLGGAEGVGEILTVDVVDAVGGKEGVKEIITPDVSEILGSAEDFSQYLAPEVLDAIGGMEGLDEILSQHGAN